jgi:hypothetical protein
MKHVLKILSLLMIISTPVLAAEATTTAPAIETVTEAVEITQATLKDGTTISIEGENIFVVSADGTKTPAPDGAHELADGTSLSTKGGKLVSQ